MEAFGPAIGPSSFSEPGIPTFLLFSLIFLVLVMIIIDKINIIIIKIYLVSFSDKVDITTFVDQPFVNFKYSEPGRSVKASLSSKMNLPGELFLVYVRRTVL